MTLHLLVDTFSCGIGESHVISYSKLLTQIACSYFYYFLFYNFFIYLKELQSKENFHLLVHPLNWLRQLELWPG